MIIYDYEENKVKYIVNMGHDSMGNAIYVANDNKEYGICKNTNYRRIDEPEICNIFNEGLNRLKELSK